MKDKWALHLSQIAFFGLSPAIWQGFLGGGDLRGIVCFRSLGAMWAAEAGVCIWVCVWGESQFCFRPPGPQFAASQAWQKAAMQAESAMWCLESRGSHTISSRQFINLNYRRM